VLSGASRVLNVDTLFFMLGWDRYGFNKKLTGTHYTKVMFLHLLGSADHVVHFGASGGEMSTHYFSCSGGTGTDSTKSSPGHVTPDVCFCIRMDPRVT
jgi:hypothetical protein